MPRQQCCTTAEEPRSVHHSTQVACFLPQPPANQLTETTSHFIEQKTKTTGAPLQQCKHIHAMKQSQLKIKRPQRTDTLTGTVPSLSRRARGSRLIHKGTRIKSNLVQLKLGHDTQHTDTLIGTVPSRRARGSRLIQPNKALVQLKLGHNTQHTDTRIGTVPSRRARRSCLIQTNKALVQLKLRHTQCVDTRIGTVPSLSRQARGSRLIHAGTRIEANKALCASRAATHLLHPPAKQKLLHLPAH